METGVVYKPLVTIGIPAYNQRKFLAEAVASALRVDYDNLEVIVSDDASPENLEAEIEQYKTDSRFRYYRNPSNIGRTANYRKLLYEYARGEWYLNLDGDDYLTDTGFIKNAINNISQSGRNDIVLYQFTVKEQLQATPATGHSLFQIPASPFLIAGKEYFSRYFETGPIRHLGAVYKRSVALALDFYRSTALRSDAESLLRLLFRGQVILDNKAIGIWRYTGSNETLLLDESRLANELAVFDSVAAEAAKHVGNANALKWKRRAKNHLVSYYMDSLVSRPSFQNWKKLAKHSRLSWVHLKIWGKYFLSLKSLHHNKTSQ